MAYFRSPQAEARERLGLIRVAGFRSKLTRMRGFVGVCETHAVLAFRGTEPANLPNWITDAAIGLAEGGEFDGRVHVGFSSVLKRSWDRVEAAIEEVGGLGRRPLFVTGHSMGGALAVLAGCRLAKGGQSPAAIYTYGAPRVGDAAFCAGYRLPTFRVVNRLDLVPEVPFAGVEKLLPRRVRVSNEKLRARLRRLAGKVPCYAHVPTFVYIDHDGSITENASIEPWHAAAVAQAVATRGKSFLAGVTDHLIGNYIRALDGSRALNGQQHGTGQAAGRPGAVASRVRVAARLSRPL